MNSVPVSCAFVTMSDKRNAPANAMANALHSKRSIELAIPSSTYSNHATIDQCRQDRRARCESNNTMKTKKQRAGQKYLWISIHMIRNARSSKDIAKAQTPLSSDPETRKEHRPAPTPCLVLLRRMMFLFVCYLLVCEVWFLRSCLWAIWIFGLVFFGLLVVVLLFTKR